MIVVRLSGGLGNQMFQFATAYACARRLNTEVVVDLSLYQKNNIHHGYELDRVFGLVLREFTQDEEKDLCGIFSLRFLKKYFSNRILSKFKPKFLVLEPHFHYWPLINEIANQSYLDGYWQSEKYFQSIESELRMLFQFKPLLDSYSSLLTEKMRIEESVSVHVRRGDYVSNRANKLVHDVNLHSYYQKAIDLMSKRLSKPTFYVFTDDYNWVVKHMNLSVDYKIIHHNIKDNSFRDMQLISNCKHHILANSSFSWWGSWLNHSKSKIVICPKQWFTEAGMKKRNPCDLYPQNSILI